MAGESGSKKIISKISVTNFQEAVFITAQTTAIFLYYEVSSYFNIFPAEMQLLIDRI